MAECTRLPNCVFFARIDSLPKTAGMLRLKYCHDDFHGCARFLCASNGIRPPDELFPNETDSALLLRQNAWEELSAIFSEGFSTKQADLMSRRLKGSFQTAD